MDRDGSYVHLLGIPNVADQVAADLHNLVAHLVVALQQHLDLGVVVLAASDALGLLRKVHGRQVVVRLQQLVDGVTHQFGPLLERAQFLRVDQQIPQLVPVDVLFELAQDPHHRFSHALEFALQRGRDADEHRLQRPELVR